MQNPTGSAARSKNIPSAESGRITDEIALERVQHARTGGDVATMPYPPRAAQVLTEGQRDGIACVLCGRQAVRMIPVGTLSGGDQVFACVSCVEPSPVAPTSAMWPAGEPESVRQAAEWADITAQIREITQLIRPVVDERYGRGTGVLLAELVEALLSGRIDVEAFTTLAEALKAGDLATLERALS